ncbi:Cytokinin-O-glucosyltransferase 3 [Zea mays]|uniref:Cytokinin-O-glucosyltransferase 3 n=1 Tax=Zea mays TaxID=4577 RepID=A0A1D6JAL1_MAIZE|nr:Cytokinin-O-glucosyltransferase 3 [Zea mays]
MEATLCPKPHFVVIPWPATSHMIPIVDIGCLLAAHGAAVTIITTPSSSQLVQSRVDRAGQGSAGVTVTAIPFPGAEAGLPDGCERTDHIPSPDLVPNFFVATARFGEAVARHCRRLPTATAAHPRPSCVVAGMCHTWAHGVARELGAPCFIFHGFCAFALLCCEYLNTHRPHEAVGSPDELFDLPALPPFEFRFQERCRPGKLCPGLRVDRTGAEEKRQQKRQNEE